MTSKHFWWVLPCAIALSASARSVQAQSAAYSVSRDTARDARARSAEDEQVANVIRSLFAAVERNDMAALDTLYAGDSLTVIEGAGINRSWRDYKDHHLGPELADMHGLRYRPSDIEVRRRGNVAWVIFRYTLQAQAGARAVDVVGRGTAVLERNGRRWVVRHTHTSGRARRPTDPPAQP